MARHFADVCRTLGRPELADDDRFSTPRDLRHNSAEFIAILDEVFASKTLGEWAERFEAAGIWWEPVSTPAEVLEDAQLLETGGFVDVTAGDGALRLAAGPVSFATGAQPSGGGVPVLGAHTED